MKIFTLLVGLVSLIAAGYCQPSSQRLRLDEQSLTAVYPLLRDIVLDAVQVSGGDPETQQVHWVIGFSTGHFAKDPTAAEAKRYLASKLIEELVISGDKVSIFAWEMDVWEHTDGSTRTRQIHSLQDVLSIHELLPRTPRQGTVGGHDTERAFTEIVQIIGNSQDAVIILLTPTAASIAAPGTRVWGQNHPNYQAALRNWMRLTKTSTGASIELPYRVIKDQGEIIERRFEVLIFVPRRFAGTKIQSGSRSANVFQITSPGHVDSETKPPPEKQTSLPRARTDALPIPLPIIIMVVFLIALFVWLVKTFWVPSPLTVIVNDNHSIVLRSKNEGIALVGTPDVSVPEGWYQVTIRGAPRQEIARILPDSAGILVRASNGTTMLANDLTHNEYTVKAGDQARIEFRGSEPSERGLPNREWQVEVLLSVERTRG